MTTKRTAATEYADLSADIGKQIEKLQQLAEQKFGHDTSAINWGHVGDLGRIGLALDELIESIEG